LDFLEQQSCFCLGEYRPDDNISELIFIYRTDQLTPHAANQRIMPVGFNPAFKDIFAFIVPVRQFSAWSRKRTLGMQPVGQFSATGNNLRRLSSFSIHPSYHPNTHNQSQKQPTGDMNRSGNIGDIIFAVLRQSAPDG